jgi:hypothetical protein
MQKYIFSAVVITIIGFLIFYQGGFIDQEPARALKPTAKATIGSKEDPEARIKYQLMKLRDPKTGKIPENIRQKELTFASKLPVRGTNNLLSKTGEQTDVSVVSNNWQLRGPHNVGGRTRALGVDITNETTVIAGGVSGGIWRSTNNGTTWIKTTEPQQLHSVTCLVQDTRAGHTSTWYYGTGENRGNSASGDGSNSFYLGDGIFKSTDGGLSWTQLPSLTRNSPQDFSHASELIWNLALDQSNTTEDEVYAAAYGVIYRSVDGGTNWDAVLGDLQSRYTDVVVSSSGVVYATFSSEDATNKGIWRSTDGTTWTNITPAGWPATDYRRIVLDIAPSNENVVYFLADTPGSGMSDHNLWRYEYLSGDGSGSGGSWTDRSANVPAEGGSTGDFSSQDSYNLLIKVKPDNENVVFIGGINLYRSTDGFSTTGNTTWIGGYDSANDNFGNYPNQHADQHALAFYPSNINRAISGHDGGLSLTTDITAAEVEWLSRNNGYYTTQFYTCTIDYTADGDNLIMGGMQDNGSYMINSANPTLPWYSLLSGDGAYCAVGEGIDNYKYYYISAQEGQVFRLASNDVNFDWARVDPEVPEQTEYLFINPFVLDRNNSKMMYVAGGSVLWRNSDLTAIEKYNSEPTNVNWTQLTNSTVSSDAISSLEVSTTPANRLYYGTINGAVYRLDEANSGDPIPTNITSGSFPAGYVSSISVDPSNSDNVMLVFGNYNLISIWYSSNAGASWQNISGNLEENTDGTGSGPAVNWAEVLPTDEGTIYMIGTSTGLYSTVVLNGTSTVWAQEGPTTIGNVVVDMIDSRTTDNLVIVATHGNGMYSANVSAVVSVEEKPDYLVSNFSLKQNYPNPFNPNTTIEYNISEPSSVRLKIFNIQGKEIATLINSEHSPGNYSVNWNGQDRFGRPVASGTYIYQITAGDYRESKRMILMR